MTTQTHDKAIVITGPAIGMFRLASLRGMLRMEKAGMATRGGALRPQIAKEFGLKPRDSYDVYIDKINALIEECKADPEVQKNVK